VYTVSAAFLGALVWVAVLYFRTPPTREEVKARLYSLVTNRSWTALAKALDEAGGNPSLRDMALYFRGLLYLNSSPGPDPERFLAEVAPDSEFFRATQALRLAAWCRSPTAEKAASLADSMEKATFRNPIYYRLRLEDTQRSYADTVSLYDEFAREHKTLFNFTELKHGLHGTVGVYFEANLSDVIQIPPCIILFMYREVESARRECLTDQLGHVLNRYDKLYKNNGDLRKHLPSLCIDPELLDAIPRQARTPLPKTCGAQTP